MPVKPLKQILINRKFAQIFVILGKLTQTYRKTAGSAL